MGVVYRARRSDQQFERDVAIKLLNNPLASDDARRRFFAERQILADLNHPNVAQLLDGGTTEEGIPYLVMEFIDGQPIDEYCRGGGRVAGGDGCGCSCASAMPCSTRTST